MNRNLRQTKQTFNGRDRLLRAPLAFGILSCMLLVIATPVYAQLNPYRPYSRPQFTGSPFVSSAPGRVLSSRPYASGLGPQPRFSNISQRDLYGFLYYQGQERMFDPLEGRLDTRSRLNRNVDPEFYEAKRLREALYRRAEKTQDPEERRRLLLEYRRSLLRSDQESFGIARGSKATRRRDYRERRPEAEPEPRVVPSPRTDPPENKGMRTDRPSEENAPRLRPAESTGSTPTPPTRNTERPQQDAGRRPLDLPISPDSRR